MRLRRLLPACLIWVPVALTIVLGLRSLGSPYVIWSYDWQGRRDGPRHYVRCTYLGPAGAITERPMDGRCGWVRFAKGRP